MTSYSWDKRPKLRRGVFIALEGIDGSGKSTQAKDLRDYFREIGFTVSHFREPTDGPYGRKIRQLANGSRHTITPTEEMELFIQDRIEDCRLNIKPALDRRELVLIDRYYFSTIAYQGALGIDPAAILQRNEEIAIIPHQVLIVDVPVSLGLDRIRQFREEDHTDFEKADYLEKVRKIFLSMKAPYIQVVDGARHEEAVFEDLRCIVQNVIDPFIEGNESVPDAEEGFGKGLMTFEGGDDD